MTKKQIALAVAGTAAVAATVGTLYAIYRRRKSLKDMMAPRLRKFTPVQRKRFVVESHHHNLPGNTADEIVEKADNAVRRAKGTLMKRKLSKRPMRLRRKRSSSTINHGKAAKIVLGVLSALAVAGGTTYAVLPRSKQSPSPPSPSSPSAPHSSHKYQKKNVKIGQHTKTIVGFDFDGVLHGCVSPPDTTGQVHPTSFDIQTLIRDKCVCTEITNIMKGHLANHDDVFIVSSNTTVGVHGIDTFLKHYGIPLPRARIITAPGAKSTHINRHKITLFYEDSKNHVNEIRRHATKCKVIHWTQAQRTPRNHKSPSSAVVSMYKKTQHFIRGREAIKAKWIRNPLTTVRLRYAVYLCIRSILNESKGMSLFQLATASKRLGQSFTPQVKHSSAHILLVRYPNDVYLLKNHKDRWMTPGGEVDSIHGKNVLFNTMKREFEEETGGDSRGNTHCPRLKKGWSYYDGGGRDNKGVWKTYRIYIARIDEASPWDVPL